MDFLLTLLTILVVIAAAFFLFVGLWEGVLVRFLTEAQDLEERSLLQAMRKVVLRKIALWNRKVIWPRYEQQISKRILYAGGLDGLTPDEFMALQEVSLLGFTLVGAVFINFMQTSMSIDIGWLYLSGFSLFGLFFPMIWLRDQIKKRHFKMTRELPYNLDLLTLSVEAGLDFQAAVDTVVKKGRQGPLVQEMSLMLRELRMGKMRQEALRSMADRVGLPALTQFVNALIQADRMGTSLGKVLRILSTQLRIDRTQRAEKLAGEAPVKMLFPLIACIFPTVFLVLFGPIVFQFVFGGAAG